MPTVLRFGGYRILIYTNDHRPAPVHVIGNDCEAVFNLGCPTGPVVLRENYGFAQQDLNRIAETLTRELPQLCERWEEIHGN